MGKMLRSARGSLIMPDVVELYEDRVVIRHPVGPAIKLPLREISSVELERLGLFGHLYFSVRGQVLLPGRVRYERRFEQGMVEMKDAIRRQIAALNDQVAEPRSDAAASTDAVASTDSAALIEEIRKWADLREKGLITEEEYELKRRQILFGSEGIAREKEIVREIVKVPCRYCGTLNENTSAKCGSCGAPLR